LAGFPAAMFNIAVLFGKASRLPKGTGILSGRKACGCQAKILDRHIKAAIIGNVR